MARNKFRAVRTSHKGYSFGSKLEAAVFDKLGIREILGEIKDIKVQQTVVLQEGTKGKKGTRITWRVDFKATLTDTGEPIYIEAKGAVTPDYLLKLKLWRKNPPAMLQIYMGSYQYNKIVETIIPIAKELP